MHGQGKVFGSLQFALHKRLVDDHLRRDVGEFAPLPGFHLFPLGPKFRCIRSTPTEMQSISENDFECLASTGVKSRRTVFPNSAFGSPNLTFAPRLFDWPRTGDEDVHESPGALLPVRTGRHMGDANQCPK